MGGLGSHGRWFEIARYGVLSLQKNLIILFRVEMNSVCCSPAAQSAPASLSGLVNERLEQRVITNSRRTDNKTRGEQRMSHE